MSGAPEKKELTRDILIFSSSDEPTLNIISRLEEDGFRVDFASDFNSFYKYAGSKNHSVYILNYGLIRNSETDISDYLKTKNKDCNVILISDKEDGEKPSSVISRRIFGTVSAPPDPEKLVPLVKLAYDNTALVKKSRDMEKSQDLSALGENFARESEQMKKIYKMISKVAPTDSSVLLVGESGTGKEIIANLIHKLSPRKNSPFITINCAAIPETLLESELFGFVKGAFTGASSDKKGLFEAADTGTFFLDEIGEMPLATQVKLLRILQNREIRPLGSNRTIKVDTRIIAATNKDLDEEVKEKKFREDLFYRLNVIKITIPPLRERKETIPSLVTSMISRYAGEYKKSVSGISKEALAILLDYDFPGNIRELENIIQHAVIISEEDIIDRKDLPDNLSGAAHRLPVIITQEDRIKNIERIITLEEVEKEYIKRVFVILEGNVGLTADKLGISRVTLWRKLKRYNLKKYVKE